MIKDKQRLISFLKEIISQRQQEIRTPAPVDVRSFYNCEARAYLAETILDILENGFRDADDCKIRSGDRVFNPETQTFEEEK